MKKHILKSLTLAIAITLAGTSCSSVKEQTSEIKWATFNIRLDTPYDSLNNWEYRKDSVASFIRNQDLDIVGMQEVLHNQLVDLKTRLPEYAEIGVGREDGKTKGEYAPIFFKKDRFEVLDNNTFCLSQYPDSIGFIGWDGACTRIATWAKMKDKQNGKIFMAINTHFDHVGTEARRKGALLIIEKIKEIVGDKPAVLTGDFNVNDSSEAYNTLTTNSFVLKDAHKEAQTKEGVDYTFHNFGRIEPSSCEKIDFIFITPNIKVSISYIPEEAKQEGKFLSDHNPEVVQISF
ncbi:MAG: endonuclease/exonuclease/phosphatase family protein [Candidatus Phocaeicola faecigallinarum]|uniref:Endonuclease/exonuclease/phosphatase family protein n=1 Tax=Candidatus Phocaeicola faecigallinarum TaxID=2838732 RepID=A0A948TBV9_9BACT|nr:endonuclease/exonuclease/phosphatase family protein [Candidatus Phocaeicola faecigallinarum]